MLVRSLTARYACPFRFPYFNKKHAHSKRKTPGPTEHPNDRSDQHYTIRQKLLNI